MTTRQIRPWLFVNVPMYDDYRENVVDVALQHLPQAATALQLFAGQALSAIRIPGFRSLSRAPQEVVKRHTIQAMQKDNRVTTAVICLWAEAKQDRIAKLTEIVTGLGWHIRPDWSWEQAQEGFYSPEDFEIVETLFDEIPRMYEDLEKDDLLLATFWVSGGLVQGVVEEHIDEKTLVSSGQETLTALPQEAADQMENDVVDSSCLTSDTSAIEDFVIEEVVGKTLEELVKDLQCNLDSLTETQQTAITQAQQLIADLEAGNVEDAQSELKIIDTQVQTWQSCRTKLRAMTGETASQIIEGLNIRLDLDPDQTMRRRLQELSESEVLSLEPVSEVLMAADHIFSYDVQKNEALVDLDRIQAEIVAALGNLGVWLDDTTAYEDRLIERDALADITLEVARGYITSAKELLQSLIRQLAQYRESSCNRIVTFARSLQESQDVPSDYTVIEDINLSEISPERVNNLLPKTLVELEQALEGLMNRQATQAKSSESATLAAALAQDWQPELFKSLLGALADENRDTETVLLLLAASEAHPSSDNLTLTVKVVDSYLRGLELFSGEGSPSRLFNLGISTLLRGWAPQEPISKAKLCLYLIAAKYAGEYLLPSEFLWDVTTEWPFGGMPGWDTLWQQALLGESVPVIVDEQQDDVQNTLEQARKQIEQMFIREGGVITRLHSIKSHRHQALFQNEILPKFEEMLHRLSNLEVELTQRKESYEIARLTAQLRTLIQKELSEEFNEKSLEEWYERAVYQVDVQDQNPFHRRTTLRILTEYAQNLEAYANALLQYWETRAQQETILSRAALLQELSSQAELLPLGQAAIAEFMQADTTAKPEWISTQATQVLHRNFMRTLLGQAAYAGRLPRVIGYLVSDSLDWAVMLIPLLEDLASPMEIERAAITLLEQRAPNQVLLLTQQIPLELQRQAQNLRVHEEKQYATLEERLLRVGGDAGDLTEDHHLGRWPFLVQELMTRIDLYQAEIERQTVQIQEQSLNLLSEINEREVEVFKIRNSIPVPAYDLISQGFSLVRNAIRQSVLFADIRDYLSEIRYRLDHQSWAIQDLQDIVDHLQDVISGRTESTEVRSLEMVLELLQQEDLRALGLSSTDVVPSEVATRIELLQNWFAVRELPAFLGEDLSISQREKIRKLFSYFARMTAMARVYSRGKDNIPGNSPIAGDEPVVFAYWKLKYYKASALKRDCIFVALPGAPPSPQYLKQLEDIIVAREWLTYEYVFLFAPGLTEHQRRRLQQSYTDKGLVIIDEPVMLAMILAETVSRTPLGRLRAMMLNAGGAQNIDVFKVNQAVDQETGIFVGRKDIVRTLSRSGGSYALYGGRRIGKSSILKEVESQLRSMDSLVVSESFEGIQDRSDDAVARILSKQIPLDCEVLTVGDFKAALRVYLDNNPKVHVAFLLDEIDPYIKENPRRHLLIEALRTLADHYGNRFRVIVAGFMYLYGCLQGRGPYSPSSDPWQRMFNKVQVDNLPAIDAEKIVKEGFLDILGWDFENRAVARWIVERTSGHPAFVQYFCLKLQQKVAQRGDSCVRLQDILDIFADPSPDGSFIDHVRSTLAMNLDSIEGIIGRYVILWLAMESRETPGFTLAQAKENAELSGVKIPGDYLQRALERLKVTSVVEERSPDVFDFSVPDYPLILNRLGDTAQHEELETKLKEHFGG